MTFDAAEGSAEAVRAPLSYPPLTPPHLRYQYCPMCRYALVDFWDPDGLFRARCPACDWTYYPPNLYGIAAVVTTPDGLVLIFPPEEPPEAPAALPGGIAEFGESPEEVVIREVREETGLTVEIVRELGRWFNRDLPFGPMVQFLFETRVVGGTLRDGLEGPVAVFPEEALPAISPNRPGSRRALAAFIEARRAERYGVEHV